MSLQDEQEERRGTLQGEPKPEANKKPWLWTKENRPPAKGRPKGVRNRLGEAFIDDLYKSWKKHGQTAIQRVLDKRPHEYLRVIAQLLPREVKVTVSEFDELTDTDIIRRLATLSTALAASGICLTVGGTEEPLGEEQTLTLPAVSETA